MTQKVDRLLDLLILVGYSVAFPVTLAKRLSGHEQYDRCVMYRAIRERYVLLTRREGKRQVIRSLQLTEKGEDYIAARNTDALAMIYGRMGRAPKVFPSREAKILRLHAIATGLVMARAAGTVIPPLEKPSLLLSSRGFAGPPVDEEKAYYYAPFELQAAFEELDDRVESRPLGSSGSSCGKTAVSACTLQGINVSSGSGYPKRITPLASEDFCRPEGSGSTRSRKSSSGIG